MTDELRLSLLSEDIQCINDFDGKFVLLRAGTVNTVPRQTLVLKSIFSREIPVGSILIIKANENETLRTFVFVCCDASQIDKPVGFTKNNIFWFEITTFYHYISPN